MVIALSQAAGQSLALIITFGGVGVLATLIVAYVIAQVLAERKENQERQRRL